MKSFKELKEAIDNNIPIIWNDPRQIVGNDYTISHVDYIEEWEKWDIKLPILVQYNDGYSIDEAFIEEIEIKK